MYFDRRKKEFILDLLLLLIWIGTLFTLTYNYPTLMLKIYFMPLILSIPIIFFLDLSEHFGTGKGKRLKYEQKTRTIKGNWFTKMYTINNCYHTEHHKYPSKPFFVLQDINKHSKNDYEEKSYFSFHINLLKKLANKKNAKSK